MSNLIEAFYQIKKKAVVRFLPIDKNILFICQPQPEIFEQFHRKRFWYLCIIRGEEEKGVRWLSVNNPVHQMIIKGIFENPVLPKFTRWQNFLFWCANLKITRLVRLSNWLLDKLPKTKNALDIYEGYDFVIETEGKFQKGSFEIKSCRAGTKLQIDAWVNQVKELEIPVFHPLMN